jgi:hypothetical protein
MDYVRSDYGSKLANSCNPSRINVFSPRPGRCPNAESARPAICAERRLCSQWATRASIASARGARSLCWGVDDLDQSYLTAYINHVARSAAGGCPVVLAHGSRAISEDDPTVTRQRPQSEIRFMEDLHCLLPGPLPTLRILGRTLAIGMCLGCTAVRKEYRKHLIFGVI